MRIYLFLVILVFGFYFSCSNSTSSNKNTPPTASFTISSDSGDTNTIFEFDASTSGDIEDPTSGLEIRWDWANDGTWDTNYSTTKTTNHRYDVEGSKTIAMEVKDSGGKVASATKQLVVSIPFNLQKNC